MRVKRNPETTHADVMAVFRKAIKLVRPIKRKAR